MELLYRIFSFAAITISSFLLIRRVRPSGVVESFLFFFALFTGHVIIVGYLLSYLRLLSQIWWWAIASTPIVFLAFLALRFQRSSAFYTRRKCLAGLYELKAWFLALSHYEKTLLLALSLTIVSVNIINLAVIISSAPHGWDSMTYHLARIGYYIQQDNLGYFDANYWAQVIHPKNSTVLMLYAFLVSGRNENLMQTVEFVSYWVAIISVYGISRVISLNKSQALFSSLIFSLLIICLVESTTTQNDMLIAAYVGSIIYFLLMFGVSGDKKYLVFAGCSVGIVFGIKSSVVLAFPSLLIVALYAWLSGSGVSLRNRVSGVAVLLLSSLAGLAVFSLPSGYLENYQLFGHPIGPIDVRAAHSFEGKPLSYVIEHGTKNVLRYNLEFLSLDGFPPTRQVRIVQSALRKVPLHGIYFLGFDLYSVEAARAPFVPDKWPAAHEALSYWGILGFALVWIVVLLVFGGVVKHDGGRVLATATLVFLLAQSYSGPYDPWRGRYFIAGAVFATPVVGCCLDEKAHRIIKGYILVVVFLGSLSALLAVILRTNSPVLSIPSRSIISVFDLDRLGQLTRNMKEYDEPLRKYEAMVPKDATVAVYLWENSYEYPLFGEKLTRTIIPINSFLRGDQPIPENVDYLLYSRGFPGANPNDTFLGRNWYLRKIGE